MEKGKARPAWGLGRRLLSKSLEIAFEDPETAVRLANLGVRMSAYLGEGYDPFADRARPKRGRRGKGKKKRP